MLCGLYLEEVLQTPNTRDDDSEDTWSQYKGVSVKSMRNVVKAAALESEIVHCRTLLSGCDLVEVSCSSPDTENLNLLGFVGAPLMRDSV